MQYQVLPTKYLNPEIFTKWILDNKVIEYIIGDSIQTEIIKRCHDIIKFMCNHNAFPVRMIDIIWAACVDKHETTVRAMYDMIVEISDHLPQEALDRIYSKIKEIPLDQYNELTLNLLKGFSENSIKGTLGDYNQIEDNE